MANKKKKGGSEPMKWREAIEFLIRFAAIKEPNRMRPGDLLNLMDDLRRYLEDDGEGDLASELAEADSKPTKLKEAIEVVRTVLDAAAGHKQIDIELGPTIITFDGSRLDDDRGALVTDGTLRDSMADGAAADLSDAKPWQICRCPECDRRFLAARKGQIYCSHRCASAAASRDYRTTHASDRAQKERARYQIKKMAGGEREREK
jgi:hypothetical protein